MSNNLPQRRGACLSSTVRKKSQKVKKKVTNLDHVSGDSKRNVFISKLKLEEYVILLIMFITYFMHFNTYKI